MTCLHDPLVCWGWLSLEHFKGLFMHLQHLIGSQQDLALLSLFALMRANDPHNVFILLPLVSYSPRDLNLHMFTNYILTLSYIYVYMTIVKMIIILDQHWETQGWMLLLLQNIYHQKYTFNTSWRLRLRYMYATLCLSFIFAVDTVCTLGYISNTN